MYRNMPQETEAGETQEAVSEQEGLQEIGCFCFQGILSEAQQ